MTSPKKGRIKSVIRVFQILESLKKLDGANLTELADEMDMALSTTHRYLATLHDCGYVTKEDGQYYIGLRFLDLGGYAYTRKEVYHLIGPKIDKLAKETQERAQFLVEEHGEVIFIHRTTGKHGVSAGSRLGGLLPVNATAAGKAILSRLPEKRVDEILEKHTFPKYTENTITNEEKYRKELKKSLERGHSFNDQEYIRGLRTVGVPVVHPDDHLIGAITVSGPSYRLREERFREQLPNILKGVANEIELELAY